MPLLPCFYSTPARATTKATAHWQVRYCTFKKKGRMTNGNSRLAASTARRGCPGCGIISTRPTWSPTTTTKCKPPQLASADVAFCEKRVSLTGAFARSRQPAPGGFCCTSRHATSIASASICPMKCSQKLTRSERGKRQGECAVAESEPRRNSQVPEASFDYARVFVQHTWHGPRSDAIAYRWWRTHFDY